MKMRKILSAICIITIAIFLIVPFKVSAALPGGIKDWNEAVGVDNPTTVSTSKTKDAICAELFKGDPDNIFRETICSLISIVSLSVTNFATEVSCTVQKFGASNYDSKITYSLTTGTTSACTPSIGTPNVLSTSGAEVFGDSTRNTGFYANRESQTTASLIRGNAAATGTTTANGWIYQTFTITRGLMSILAIVGLFVFAFANILHIDVNTYAIKKVLPAAAFAIVGGWLSIYIVYFVSRIVDFLYRLNIFSPYNVQNPIFNVFGGAFQLNFSDLAPQSISLVFNIGQNLINGSGGGEASFMAGFLGGILLIISSAAVYALEFTLALRPLAVGLLTGFAPLAFATVILPQTQAIFKKWWTILFIALFYAPIVNFTFYLLNQIDVNYSTDQIVFMIAWVLKIGVIAFLVRLPFTVESDTKKLAYALSKTGFFGTTLGLNQFVKQPTQQNGSPAQQVTDNQKLKTQAAMQIIASAGQKNLQNIRSDVKRNTIEQSNAISRNTAENMSGIIRNANEANMSRPSNLLVKSTADLSPDAFRKIINNSDLRLWKDENLLNELKNKDGQILDEQGAAIRADSARKVIRLAQIVDQDKITNPDAIKLLAQKGILDTLPLNILKKALDSSVINESDLMATFKDQTPGIVGRLKNTELSKSSFIGSSQAKELMERDRKDNVSGFRDLSKMFLDVVRNPNVLPPPPPSVVKSIVDGIKSSDRDVFEKNGMYFLQRLGDINRQSKNSISQTLEKSGTTKQTALSIAANPQLTLDDVKNYAPNQLSQENLTLLREGFINRDLSNNLTSHIARLISDDKVLISKGITQKIAQNLKEEKIVDLSQVKSAMKQVTEKFSQNLSPQEAKDLSFQVDKYYPGSTLKTEGPMTKDDVEKSKQRAENVVNTVTALEQQGVNKQDLADNPQEAMDKVENFVNENIQKVLSGEVKADEKFDNNVSAISNNNQALRKQEPQYEPNKNAA